MSSFLLELDTTPPNINIVAPNYTVSNTETEIIVEGDEKLTEYQEIYIVDSSGKRHDVIFHYNDDKFIGKLTFHNYSIGIATIYARLKDEVYNLSDTAIKTIDIKKAARIFLRINYKKRSIDINETFQAISFSNHIRNTNAHLMNRSLLTGEKSREIEVKRK